jgi:hypothetical protein
MEEMKLRGLSTVRVSKDDLLKKLKYNRTEHEKTYNEIMAVRQNKILDELHGFKAKFKKELAVRMDKATSDIEYTPSSITLSISALKPENHTKDYDRVISLLELSLDEELELSSSELNQYVNDDWSWKQGFMTCSGTYLAPTATWSNLITV